MKKNRVIVKSILIAFFVFIFMLLVSGKTEATTVSDAEMVSTLKQQIADVQIQIMEKQVELLKQQVINVQSQIIQLLQQKIAEVQTQITEKRLAVATPSTPEQQIKILQQKIVGVQTQIAEKQKQLAALTPSTPAVVSPSPAPLEEKAGQEYITEGPVQEVSKKSALAAITSFFSANNFSQLIFFIVIIFTVLVALYLFRTRDKEKNWIPYLYLVIVLAPFVYRAFYSKNWLILLALSIIVVIIDWILQSNKQRQAKFEFLR